MIPDESQFFPVEVRLRDQDAVVVWCSGVSVSAELVRFENGRLVGFGFGSEAQGVASIKRDKIVGEIKVHPPG